jgi:hypothetical protein
MFNVESMPVARNFQIMSGSLKYRKAGIHEVHLLTNVIDRHSGALF